MYDDNNTREEYWNTSGKFTTLYMYYMRSYISKLCITNRIYVYFTCNLYSRKHSYFNISWIFHIIDFGYIVILSSFLLSPLPPPSLSVSLSFTFNIFECKQKLISYDNTSLSFNNVVVAIINDQTGVTIKANIKQQVSNSFDRIG